MRNKGMTGNGQLEIIVIENGKFVKLLKNRSLHPRKGWFAAKYKGQYWPVFWNATGHECIDISNSEWVGVSTTSLKELEKTPYGQATMKSCR